MADQNSSDWKFHPLASDFERRGPFRYFDLPTEIRCQILDLALAPGHVALSLCVDKEYPRWSPRVEARFPEWTHEPPAWELLQVSHRMQDEAKAALCSGKNIFYLPFGAMGQLYDWAYRTMRTIPPVKKLDCAFDMRDVAENTSAMVQRMKAENRLDVVGDDFERFSRSEKAELLHHESFRDLLYVWTDKIDAFSVHDLDLLRLDLSNCRCLSGCCRLGQELLENLEFDQTYAEYPQRIEIIGALKEEENLWRAAVRRGSHVPLERIFFIDAPEHV